jgi:outer membrane protein, heavy metal efflux system
MTRAKAFALIAATASCVVAAQVRLALAQDSPMPMSFVGLSLSQAEQRGIDFSPDVAASRARVASARAALAIARWGVVPSGFASFTESPQAGTGPTQTIAAHQTTVGIQANLTELLLGYSPQVRQADALLRFAISDEAAAERTERIAAARTYFGSLKAIAVLAAREDALRLARSELKAAQTRFGAGDVPRVDVVRADVAVARAEADAENARAQVANARDGLRVETGASDDMLATTSPGPPPAVPPLASNPEGAAAAALRFRPEVQAAQNNVDAAQGGLRSARLALVPPVTVSSGYATGVDSGQRVAGRSVTAQVSVPLPFGPAARIDQANAALAEARARLASVQRTVALESAAAARTLLAADRAAAATLRARDAARQALDAVELGYRSGAASGLEVTVARSTYLQAQVDELSAVYDEALAGAIFDVEVGR